MFISINVCIALQLSPRVEFYCAIICLWVSVITKIVKCVVWVNTIQHSVCPALVVSDMFSFLQSCTVRGRSCAWTSSVLQSLDETHCKKECTATSAAVPRPTVKKWQHTEESTLEKMWKKHYHFFFVYFNSDHSFWKSYVRVFQCHSAVKWTLYKPLLIYNKLS